MTQPKLMIGCPNDRQRSNSLAILESVNSHIKVLYLSSVDQPNGYDGGLEMLYSNSDIITFNGINITEFFYNQTAAAEYQVLIIGSTTFETSGDMDSISRAEAVIHTGKPVLAFSSGGINFFKNLGYNYGGSRFSCDGLNLTENHAILSQTYSFPIPGIIPIEQPQANAREIQTNGIENTTILGYDNSSGGVLLVENTGFLQKILYLGLYPISPESSLYMLIHNCIEWLANSKSNSSSFIPTRQSTTQPVAQPIPINLFWGCLFLILISGCLVMFRLRKSS